MSKEKLDVIVMVLAFVAGGYLSFINNPMFGVGLMVAILTTWSLAPKVPKLVKAGIRK